MLEEPLASFNKKMEEVLPAKSPRMPRVAQMAPMRSKAVTKISYSIQFSTGTIIRMKTRTDILCKKIYSRISSCLNIDESHIRCVLNGERLQKKAYLYDYDVEDGDVIDCYIE